MAVGAIRTHVEVAVVCLHAGVAAAAMRDFRRDFYPLAGRIMLTAKSICGVERRALRGAIACGGCVDIESFRGGGHGWRCGSKRVKPERRGNSIAIYGHLEIPSQFMAAATIFLRVFKMTKTFCWNRAEHRDLDGGPPDHSLIPRTIIECPILDETLHKLTTRTNPPSDTTNKPQWTMFFKYYVFLHALPFILRMCRIFIFVFSFFSFVHAFLNVKF